MDRLISAAGFVRSNMPDGTAYDAPALSAEDAWDVAAFLVSRPRPRKAGLERDYPRRLEKAVDAGYGPYADGFGQAEHTFGPFGPIRAAVARLKAAGAAPDGR